VDWHPWGEEALAKAKAENKPIFLSILKLVLIAAAVFASCGSLHREPGLKHDM